MTTRRLTVSVPQPCQENWQDMTPQAQGRFCSSCQKTVVDFTGMSDAEVVTWLGKEKEASCGRFRPDQLSRTLHLVAQRNSRWTLRTFFLSIALWLGKNSAEAQQLPNKRLETTLLQSSQPTLSPSDRKNDSTVVAGIVLASMAGNTSQIKIRLNDTVETTADAIGHFKISYTKTVPLDKQWLVISAIGYQTQRFLLADIVNLKTFRVALLPENNIIHLLPGVLGGISVSGIPIKSNDPIKRIYYRIEDFLR